MAKEVTVDMFDEAKNITVVVHINFTRLKEWRIRFFIASQLIKLGALIGGFGFEIEDRNDG
jgi:hypothetical protein